MKFRHALAAKHRFAPKRKTRPSARRARSAATTRLAPLESRKQKDASMKKIPTIYTLVRQHYPGLIFNIEAIIRESEQEYCKHQQEDADSFLWEHTTQVAAMAAKLAVEEGTHPLHPVIAALFHDCGKFDCGCYHEDDTPEEEHSARRAEQLLAEAGMPDKDIRDILGSLIALYNEDLQDNDLTNIVHDADFLVKSGPMGIAGFWQRNSIGVEMLYHIHLLNWYKYHLDLYMASTKSFL